MINSNFTRIGLTNSDNKWRVKQSLNKHNILSAGIEVVLKRYVLVNQFVDTR